MSNMILPNSPLLLCNILLTFMESSAVAMDGFAQSLSEMAGKSPAYLQSHPEEVKNALTLLAEVMQRGTLAMQTTVIEGRLAVASALPIPTDKHMA